MLDRSNKEDKFSVTNIYQYIQEVCNNTYGKLSFPNYILHEKPNHDVISEVDVL